MGEDIPALMIGIDEAGRGPVVGDMIICILGVESDRIEQLKKIGVRDSKELTPAQRSKILKKIISISRFYATINVPPIEIDKKNINVLVRNSILSLLLLLLNTVFTNYNNIVIYIDEVKGTLSYLRNTISKQIRGKRHVEIIMEPNADRKYPVVSAASIVAKYLRDQGILALKPVFGDLGSGYPSDPYTRRWIMEISKTYDEPPRIIRRTWRTLKDLVPNWYMEKARKTKRSILDYLY